MLVVLLRPQTGITDPISRVWGRKAGILFYMQLKAISIEHEMAVI